MKQHHFTIYYVRSAANLSQLIDQTLEGSVELHVNKFKITTIKRVFAETWQVIDYAASGIGVNRLTGACDFYSA